MSTANVQADSEFIQRIELEISSEYSFIEVIGAGKNGIALKIKATKSNLVFCLKAVHPSSIGTDRFDFCKDKLRKEVEILYPLDHICLPKIYQSNFECETPYYISTFHPGETFYDFQRKGAALPIEQSIYVIYSLIDVFDYLHSKGRSHCDAHRDNILISQNVFQNGIMLIDFGSGHRQSDSEPVTHNGGRLEFKPIASIATHQSGVDRQDNRGIFEQSDRRSVGILLASMKEILLSDGSSRQIEEYIGFCNDLSTGSIRNWDEAKLRLKHVVNPDHTLSRLSRFHNLPDFEGIGQQIPTSRSTHMESFFSNLVETSAFQKLRGIKQLSFCDWMYPGAVHTRYEHSLGVLDIAREGIELLLSQNNFRRQYNEFHVSALMSASLLHDIGHYPFAHVIEHYCASRFSEEKDGDDPPSIHHLANSIDIVGNNTEIVRAFRAQFDENYKAEVINIISKKRGFLTKVLDHTIDFDKIDYLKRDSYHCGVAHGLGYSSSQLLRSIKYRATKVGSSEETILFDENYSQSISAFLVLQSQMLSEVYWNERVRAIFAMFHRFLDYCVGTMENTSKFVSELRQSSGEYDAYYNVFVKWYEKFYDEKLRERGKFTKFNDGVWGFISILGRPDPHKIYKCVNKFSQNDPLSEDFGNNLNIFRQIVRFQSGQSKSDGKISWANVQRLRKCYIEVFREKGWEPDGTDAVIDIPWGKGKTDPISFVSADGSIRGIRDVSHLDPIIFSDLTIHSAPIRVFIAPRIFELARYEVDAINLAAISKFRSDKTRFKDGDDVLNA